MSYHNTNLLLEYTMILAKQKAKFGQEYFSKQQDINENTAYEVFRMAIEVFLHWTPEQALSRLTKEVVDRMRLDLVMSYMRLPYECLFNNDYTWILHKLYPDQIRYDQEVHVLRIYDKILSGEKYKWPKWYFSEAEGHERAYICLRHMVNYNMHYTTPEDLFKQFADGEGLTLLNKLGLKTVVKNEFSDPVAFLYEAMFANSDQDFENIEFLYHYYRVKYYYDRAKKIKSRTLQASREFSE